MEKITYKNSKYLLGKDLVITQPFVKYIERIIILCHVHKVKLHIVSSLRAPEQIVIGTIVAPAKMSNHFVGCAFDCNIYDSKGKLHTSKELAYPKNEIKTFIEAVKKDGIRWGGDFKKKDVVHFDFPLNIRFPEQYKDIFNTLHDRHI